MSVLDNQLNWRRVFADTGKDVSGWTLAKRMSLPDWCFGSRQVIARRVSISTPGQMVWEIGLSALPDPACIWTMGIFVTENDYKTNYVRIGLRDTVPTTEAQMNGAQNILPDFGNLLYTPPRINPAMLSGTSFNFTVRKGIVTGGKKLVVEGFLHGSGSVLICIVYLVISGLPNEVPAFLNPEV